MIADANGEKLTDAQRRVVRRHARTICMNWEKVIAEAVFKYAGSVYKDIKALNDIMGGGNMWQVNGSDQQAKFNKAVRTYAKHWGELKGFALSLHTSGVNLGEIGVRMDRLIGLGPVLPDGTQVNGMADGAYTMTSGKTLDGFARHMLQLQKLMAEEFSVEAGNNDQIAGIANLAEVLGSADSAEND